MKHLIRHLSRDKKVATMLLISSLIIGLCALTPALFVIIVLNKYLASGITATLISLTIGAIIALTFEFVLTFLIVLIFLNWTAAVITAIFMLLIFNILKWKKNLNFTQDSLANIELLLVGLLTISIITVGAFMIMGGRLDIGVLIGSNILAGRAFQGTSKYAKAKEFIKHRDRAVSEIVGYLKTK